MHVVNVNEFEMIFLFYFIITDKCLLFGWFYSNKYVLGWCAIYTLDVLFVSVKEWFSSYSYICIAGVTGSLILLTDSASL